MNSIVFLCGSLENGKDGVGDYTRLLTSESIRQGHTASIISLNDKFMREVSEEAQAVGDTVVSVLRLPSNFTWKQRIALAKAWIDKSNPEWLSLQFVPFSFHSKGLPVFLPNFLRQLGKNRKWHFMFHELWVGMNQEASCKLKLWGILQKILFKNLINFTCPRIIHTQTRVYEQKLKRLGAKPVYLPLFSNIPTDNRIDISHAEKKSMSLVLFGAIHPCSFVEEFTREVADFSLRNKANISLIAIGSSRGNEIDHWKCAWLKYGLVMKIFGELPSSDISRILANATIGLSTNPILLAEKSGTVAAMRAHGLPVLCMSPNWTCRGIDLQKRPDGIFNYSPGNFEKLFSDPKVFYDLPDLQSTARVFNESLNDKLFLKRR